MIERRISFYWHGRMSWMRYMTLASFRHHNPDWAIWVYTSLEPIGAQEWPSGEQGDRNYKGVDYLPQLPSLNIMRDTWEAPITGLAPAHRSDLFRWDMLYQHGGFYADMDILWVKPMEELYQAVKDKDALFCLESGWMAIGFHAASPKCQLMGDFYADAIKHGNRREYQGFGTDTLYRFAAMPPAQANSDMRGIHAVAQYQRRYPEVKIVTVPDEIVYPFDWRRINDIFLTDQTVPASTVGIHTFGGAPITQEWNQRLTAENCRTFNNTFTRYAKSML